MINKMVYSSYAEVRDQMKAGGVIAFSGRGWLSWVIKKFTRSKVSHVGVVLEIDEQGRVMVMESTTMNGKKGVQIHRLSQRVKHYNGEMWWLPLSTTTRKKMDTKAFWTFLWEQDGKKYDAWQAIKSAIPSIFHKEHFDKFFCSELVAAALEFSGAIPKLNASEVTPDDLVEFRIYAKKYFQIKGEKKRI